MPTIYNFVQPRKTHDAGYGNKNDLYTYTIRHKKSLEEIQGFRGDEWTRTTDSRIFSPMLYQLSYITFLK